MASNKSNFSTAVFYQNNFVRGKFGRPVIPMGKHVNNLRKSRCEFCNEEYLGSYDKHILSDIHQECVKNKSNGFKPNYPYDMTSKTQNLKKAYGSEALIAIQGYFCTVCDVYITSSEAAYLSHCKEQSHFDNFNKICNKVQNQPNNDLDYDDNNINNNESPEQSKNSSKNSSQENLFNDVEQIPIRIKIENTDLLKQKDDNGRKRPLSERLGTIKKSNIRKFQTNIKKNNDSNEMNNYENNLPKPSSHYTPSRKVFVDSNTISIKSIYNNEMDLD